MRSENYETAALGLTQEYRLGQKWSEPPVGLAVFYNARFDFMGFVHDCQKWVMPTGKSCLPDWNGQVPVLCGNGKECVPPGRNDDVMQCQPGHDSGGLKVYERVYTIAQRFGSEYFHLIFEELPRLMVLLPELKNDQSIRFHCTSRTTDVCFCLIFVCAHACFAVSRLSSGALTDITCRPRQDTHNLCLERPRPPGDAPLRHRPGEAHRRERRPLLAPPLCGWLTCSHLLCTLQGHGCARVIYIPEAVACGTPTFSMVHLLQRNVRMALGCPNLSPLRGGGYAILIYREPGMRHVANHHLVETQLRNSLDLLGLSLVVHEGPGMPRKTLKEQWELFADAYAAVGPHGAGLSNMVAMARGAVVVEVLLNTSTLLSSNPPSFIHQPSPCSLFACAPRFFEECLALRCLSSGTACLAWPLRLRGTCGGF